MARDLTNQAPDFDASQSIPLEINKLKINVLGSTMEHLYRDEQIGWGMRWLVALNC